MITINCIRLPLAWLSGALVLSGLWMIDELISFDSYCGRNCLYNIPLMGNYTIYQAEGISWGFILSGVAILIALRNKQ